MFIFWRINHQQALASCDRCVKHKLYQGRQNNSSYAKKLVHFVGIWVGQSQQALYGAHLHAIRTLFQEELSLVLFNIGAYFNFLKWKSFYALLCFLTWDTQVVTIKM